MNLAVYRCPTQFLLVPTCFLPSREALARTGPARFCGWLRTRCVPEADLQAMYENTYTTLALDHPLTRTPAFPRPVDRRRQPSPAVATPGHGVGGPAPRFAHERLPRPRASASAEHCGA